MSNKITAFPAKKPLTNAAFWRIIKVKRGHTSRRSAPMLSYQEITVQVSSSGRLFPFIVVVMENIVHQCYNSNDQDTVLNQIWPSYVFHTTHSLPGAGIDRLPFQVCPQNSVYHTLQKMSNDSFQYKISRISRQKALDKCGVLAYNRNRKSIPVDGLLPWLIIKITAQV